MLPLSLYVFYLYQLVDAFTIFSLNMQVQFVIWPGQIEHRSCILESIEMSLY